MSLFLPPFLPSAGVVDPAKLSRLFVEASKRSSAQTQWQWEDGAFTSHQRTLIESGKLAKVRQPIGGPVEALLGMSSAGGGVRPDLAALTGDPNLWQVPYNTGFQEVGDGDVRVTWTSEYPELVWTIYTWQYMRETLAILFGAGTEKVRVAMRLEVDGARREGTGPMAVPTDTRWRGTGLATRSARSTCVDVSLLPAGAHTVTAVAAQRSDDPSDSDETDDEHQYEDSPPNDKIIVGHRNIICVCFALGGGLGS
jgi:hypothetical protein